MTGILMDDVKMPLVFHACSESLMRRDSQEERLKNSFELHKTQWNGIITANNNSTVVVPTIGINRR